MQCASRGRAARRTQGVDAGRCLHLSDRADIGPHSRDTQYQGFSGQSCRASAFPTPSERKPAHMCGIIGIVGKDQVAERLFDGLRRLEYRGYDSAGHLHRSTTASSSAAAPRASSTISRASSPRDPLPGDDRHRPHALGDPRRADRRQCPSAHRRRRRARPQRHHREFQAAARRADRATAACSTARPTPKSSRISSREQVERGQVAAARRSRPCCRGSTAPSRSPSCSATIPTCSSARGSARR